ncbi:Oxidoreductase BOA1 [Pseudocercospora fuligena]|uniref:Oxidoreductase BOA1 n=1 Tax=Pseudocercospora fuligena TaxID=685502 RepID=A0A8H6VAX9_9PEZI|nr:Oxidoreductase BOA1 [Pseudocercospora fuligena]
MKMVKVAIVGGTGGLAREVTDTLLATSKHEILLLSRKDAPDTPQPPATTWAKVDYCDIDSLANTLKGVHTLLSFITPQTDKDNVVQKNLINAAIKAGVKRFAPSEWVGSGLQHMEWYWGKQAIRDYLAEINRDRKVLEYCLFQPGWFTDYFAYPTQSAKYFRSFPVCIDFEHCRAFYAEGSENSKITLTTVSDFAKVVAQAVGFEGTWPEEGGIKGTEMTVQELVEVGERVRGKPFTIETLKRSDLEQNKVLCSWIPKVDHPAVGDYENLPEKLNASVLLSIADEDLNVGNEWNKLLPEYEFQGAEDFLQKIWNGK